MNEHMKKKTIKHNEPITVVETTNYSQTTPELVEDLDKSIFFSVSEAKRKTKAVRKKILETKMLPIYTVINETINKGNYKIDNIILTESQKLFLEQKNFMIYFINKDNSSNNHYSIKWD